MYDVGSTLGAVFVGTLLALYLTATTNDQGYRYFCSTLDSAKIRAVVLFVLAASTAHTGIICYAVYGYLIKNFGNTDYISEVEWSLVAHYAIFTFVAVVVQAFYAARLSTLFTGGRQRLLVGGVVALALAQLAFGIVATYSISMLPKTEDVFRLSLQDKVAWQTLAALIASVLCNILICYGMVVDMRSGRFAARSEGVVEVLTRLLVETNFITALCALLNLIFSFVFPHSGVSLAFAIVLPKLYLSSMFANISRDESPSGGISSRALTSYKHESSLSDMFKGRPFKGESTSRSTTGLHVPQDAFDPPPPGSPTWRRTPVASLQRANKADDSQSISDYGGFTTSLYLGTPKVYDEGHFSRQRDGSTIHFASPSPEPMIHFAPSPSPTPIHARHVGWAISSDGGSDTRGREATTGKGYGFI